MEEELTLAMDLGFPYSLAPCAGREVRLGLI